MGQQITVALVLCLVVCTSRIAAAQSEGADRKPRDAEPAFVAKFAAIKSEMDELVQKANAGFSAAQTAEEREALMVKGMEVYHREGTPLANQALGLVTEHASDPAAVDVLVWILTYHTGADAAVKAAELLVEHHLQNPKVQETASRFQYAPMAWTETLFRALVEADLPLQRKAQAHFQLAQCLKTKSTMPAMFRSLDGRMAKIMELRFGSEYLAELRGFDSAKIEAEAVRMFEAVVEKYGAEKYGQRTLGDYAKSAIYEIQYLGIGKTAPEISGDDIDGQAMKLSDYRGKVVVLDFWGHW